VTEFDFRRESSNHHAEGKNGRTFATKQKTPETALDHLDVVRAWIARAAPSSRRRTIETAGF